MSNISIERRYARALFELAVAQKTEDRWLTTLLETREVFKTARELEAILVNRFVDLTKRHRVIEAIADKLGMDREVRNFFKLLIDRRRLAHFDGIVTAFEEMVDEALGRVQVDLRTAQPLAPELVGEIEATLKAALKHDIKTQLRLDDRLLGGFQLAWQGRLYDASVRGRLDQLHKKLAG